MSSVQLWNNSECNALMTRSPLKWKFIRGIFRTVCVCASPYLNGKQFGNYSAHARGVGLFKANRKKNSLSLSISLSLSAFTLSKSQNKLGHCCQINSQRREKVDGRSLRQCTHAHIGTHKHTPICILSLYTRNCFANV